MIVGHVSPALSTAGSIFGLLASIVVVLGAIGAAARWLGKRVEQSIVEHTAAQTIDLKRDIDTVKCDVAKIEKEVHPNGGSSLRDSVDRVESMSSVLVARVDRLERHTPTPQQGAPTK